ncbi:lactonase family protein [Robbsia sp. KACC 23696]|uniref:lactonase family protein n=1 Tax=Robbsia sp. KACC 23696 TaxID=3149231 RepID=UPI00325B78EC
MLSGTTAFAQGADVPNAVAGAAAGTFDMLVGTYTTTNTKSKGIYVYRFDTATGNTALLSVTDAVNPSYLAVSNDRRHVYTVSEIPGDAKPGSKGGFIAAYDFDAASGSLQFKNQVSSEGNDPTYLALAPDGRYIATANYSVAADPGGSLSVFPIAADGSVGPAAINIHHEGRGPVTGRQDSSHVHSTVFSPDGRYLFASDLGVDKVYQYAYQPQRQSDAPGDNGMGPLRPTGNGYIAIPAGSGPRHLVFDAAQRHAYLTTELNAAVTVFDYNDGALKQVQVVPMTAPGFKGAIGGGAIHLSDDGRFLYTTNRGDVNQIVIYAVNRQSGTLTLVDRVSSQGKIPREFAIDPSGRWMIVGNQDSDDAFWYRRDPETGKLTPTTMRMDIGSPVFFKFLPAH